VSPDDVARPETVARPRPAAAPIRSREALVAYERSIDCIHCGLCLPACPTYRLTGREPASPRGRIYLMRSWAEGTIEASERFAQEMDFCLVCRACETVCPAGVRFGEMMEFTREALSVARPREGREARLRRLLFGKLLVDRRALGLALAIGRLYSFAPIRAVVRRLLPRSLREREALFPAIPPRRARKPLSKVTPAQGARRGRVAVLRGCVAEPLRPEMGRATAEVLSRNGFEVTAPLSPACCGALHVHFGGVREGERLARETIASFEASGAEAFVVNSAGCGSVLKEYGRLLGHDPAWMLRAESFAARVRDVSEFLVERGFEKPASGRPHRVVYADACHLLHGQRISAPPREVLRAIPGVALVELPDSGLCCGAAGIYSLTNFETSIELLERKVEAFRGAKPDVVAVGNPGCLLHYRAGMRRAGLSIPVVHPVEVLASAYSRP
jgi:glycolate oxidase iron-sulfur subunit